MTAPSTASGVAIAPAWLRVRRVEGPPVVAVRLWLWGGSRSETSPGLAWVTGRMLTEGTSDRSWRDLAESCESRGMVLSSFGGLEVHGIGVDCLARDWRRALDLVAELALESSFPADRCAWQARQGKAELESLRDEPDTKTAWAFTEQLYAPHAAGRPRPGEAASLERVDPEACRRFHRAALARGGVLAVAGDVDADEVAAAVATALDLGAGGVPAPHRAIAGLSAPRLQVATTARDQAHLFLGHLTVRRGHADLVALELASVVLGAGAGLTGRIPTRIREREGLAYSAAASVVSGAGLDPGRLVVHVATSLDTVARAEAAVREEVDRLLDGGLTDLEFEDARTFLLRREPFRRETPQQWADLLAQAALYGEPCDDPEWVKSGYRSLDRATVEAALRRHLHPEQIRVTVGAPDGRDDEADADDDGDDDDGEDGGDG
jgi:zinc protease